LDPLVGLLPAAPELGDAEGVETGIAGEQEELALVDLGELGEDSSGDPAARGDVGAEALEKRLVVELRIRKAVHETPVAGASVGGRITLFLSHAFSTPQDRRSAQIGTRREKNSSRNVFARCTRVPGALRNHPCGSATATSLAPENPVKSNRNSRRPSAEL